MRKLLCNHEIQHIGDKRTRIGKYEIRRSYEFDPLEIITYDATEDYFINPSVVGGSSSYAKWVIM